MRFEPLDDVRQPAVGVFIFVEAVSWPASIPDGLLKRDFFLTPLFATVWNEVDIVPHIGAFGKSGRLSLYSFTQGICLSAPGAAARRSSPFLSPYATETGSSFSR